MAHSKQAKKRVRQNEVRRQANKQVKTNVRNCIKNVDKAIASGDREAISHNFKVAMSALHKAVSKKIFKKSFAARNISRMAANIRKAEQDTVSK